MAAVAYYEGRCIYIPWDSEWLEAKRHHINYKEVMALEPAITHFAPLFRNKIVYVYTDNQAAMYIINKGTCKDKVTMQSLRRVFWYSAIFNFRIQAIYLPGEANVLTDAMMSLITNHLVFFLEFAETKRNLEERLVQRVAYYKTQCYTSRTNKTYNTHRKYYLKFCCSLSYNPVPATSETICRYAAFLADTHKYSSIKQYLNIIRIMQTH